MVLNTEWAQVEVIDLVNDGSGLAFGIIGGRSTGVVVKTILPGGVADRDGRLQSGDHILQIGEVNLRGLGSEQVASVLRQCGVHVRMVVARPVESTSPDYQPLNSHAPIVPTKILGDPVELDRHLIENGYTDTAYQPQASYPNSYLYNSQQTDIQLHSIPSLVDVVRNPLPIGNAPAPAPYGQQAISPALPVMLPLDMALHEPNLPETEIYTVDLRKDDLGLGITVAGYVCEKEEISGIFVKSISKGSAADFTKMIKINDRIVEVDGISVIGHTNHQAVEILRNTGSAVRLKFERYLRGPKFEQLQQAIRANELRASSPPSPSASSLPKIPLSLVQMSYLGIEPEGESRTSFDFDSAILLEPETPTNEEQEIVIGYRKSVQFSVASRESIYDKWRDDYDGAEIVIAEMHKEPSSGLGISLEGTVDVEDGKEVRPHHYIRNILPDGPVGRNGVLQSGDELLEVNGIQLKGMNHLEVVAILKQLPNFVCLVCARYPVPTRVIDTAQHRDAFQARKIITGSLQTLVSPLCPDRLVKAKSETSLASSAASADTCTGSRSRSLELVAGLPMWTDQQTVVELNKSDHGLGFSILDYQDPLNPQQTVIVVRSLVPGGVAQADGRLIPGDRLLSVNGVEVADASLERAVQVLKGAARGPVRIAVAKPVSACAPHGDTLSHTSQDTSDDQTCLDEFQECLEEYQECLEVVHICIDSEASFTPSRSSSQFLDDMSDLCSLPKADAAPFLGRSSPSPPAPALTSTPTGEVGAGPKLPAPVSAEKDASEAFASATDDAAKLTVLRSPTLAKNDSLTQSDRTSNVTHSSEKDGYETCIDESLSEDTKHQQTEEEQRGECPEGGEEVGADHLREEDGADDRQEIGTDDGHASETSDTHVETLRLNLEGDLHEMRILGDTTEADDETPTNSKLDVVGALCEDVPQVPVSTTAPVTPAMTKTVAVAVSEPCLMIERLENHICLDSKLDTDGIKWFDHQTESFETDEFFLVQYPPDRGQEVTKCSSEPNVLEEKPAPRVYRRCVYEYYNDYEDCLEAYRMHTEQQQQQQQEEAAEAAGQDREEMPDEEIFKDILLPFKCRSAPDIMDSSFVTLTYDPGPDNERGRRKSAFVEGYPNQTSDCLQMTVLRPIDNEYKIETGSSIKEMLQKHWGSTKTVEVIREENTSLGISIVGGKVDLHASATSETILGIFVKNVVPESPAGRTRQLKTGDRILEVSGVDLRNASHEKAVEAIRNASNPVKFVIQSLIPWTGDGDNQSEKCQSPPPSPITIEIPVQYQNKLVNGLEKEVNRDERQTVRSPSPASFKAEGEEQRNEQEKRDANTPEPTSKEAASAKPAENDISPRMVSPVQSDEDDEDDEEDVRELEGRTVSTMGQQIDRASAGNVKRSKEEIEGDPEEEDDFGYTTSKFTLTFFEKYNSFETL